MAMYSGFSHRKWWFSIAMLNHQRVNHLVSLPISWSRFITVYAHIPSGKHAKKTMERSTIFNGNTHEFSMAMFDSYASHHQFRVCSSKITRISSRSRSCSTKQGSTNFEIRPCKIQTASGNSNLNSHQIMTLTYQTLWCSLISTAMLSLSDGHFL